MTVKTEEAKILYICRELLKIRMTPKEFITGFLTKKHILLRYRCRTWGTKHGWNSTINLARIIGNEFRRTNVGSAHGRNKRLITEDTPFLFNMIFGALSGAEEEDAKDNKDEVIDPDIDQYLEQPETPNPDTDRPLTPLEALLKSINARINTEANLEPSALLDDTTTDVLDPTDINNPTGYLSTSADKSVNLSVDEAERTNPNPTSRLSTTANRTTLLSASEAEELMYEGDVFTVGISF
ncbi:hypothetical protein PSTG_17323 [Puccinia striiformis f. sp. tritici PST-78]|uniref:Uncharacterized protein n=1 Tax=Puccinia striiformis f. sp. tritici PST-78 TaxID=1165861 RepID=A0A0L0UQG5_9BASI|nr:hypothetical protein PSTG_17323 [Puccinia striiformis f. sp. tritici PST-78]